MNRSRDHIAGLDGLRGLAVLFVVVFHLWKERLPGGFIGVNIFFVLSGFLIARGMLSAPSSDRAAWMRAFWSKRLVRLIPAAFATLAIVHLVWTMAGWMDHDTKLDLLLSLFQVNNWRAILDPRMLEVFPTPVSHFWSLSAEIQFYMVISLVYVVFRPTAKRFAIVSIVWMVTVLWLETVVDVSRTVSARSTFNRGAEFACGILVAAFVSVRRPVLQRRIGIAIQHALIGALVIIALRASSNLSFYDRPNSFGIGVLTAVAILVTVSTNGPGAGWLERGALPMIGRISYGLYLFHWPFYMAIGRLGVEGDLRPLLTLVLLALAAPASFRWFESPLMRINRSRAAVRTRSSG